MLTVTLVIIVIALCVNWMKTKRKYVQMINAFPGPTTVPIFGNVLQFSAKQDKLFAQIRESCNNYKETFRLWAGSIGTINLVTPEDVEIILSSSKHIEKSILYDFIQPWLGTGLLTSTGSKWQSRRKILTPAFHFSILRKFVMIFGEHSEKLITNIEQECDKNINIVPVITRNTLNIICESAMGIYLNPKDRNQTKYYETIYKVASTIVYRSLCPWFYNNFIFNLTPSGWRQRKGIKILHDFTTSVIREREKNFQDSDVLDLEVEDAGKKRLAMLDLLISAKKNERNIDDEGIREEVDTFMFEGHDTTAMAICFTLLTLANHKEVQDKIVDELDNIFGSSNRNPSLQDLQNMKYLEMCIKEGLRLYPSVPLISRVLREDVNFSKFKAPAGCVVNIHIYDLHRNPGVFPNPDTFDPDRFLPENCQGRHPYSYIPFSAGPRNCIGQKFAMLEMKTMISTIFRHFRLEAISRKEDLRLITDLVLRNMDGIYIKFVKRSF